MTGDIFPESEATRPTWLVTLADLALLLVGFLLLLQALGREDPAKVAAAIRAGFAGTEVPAMPVAAAAVEGFAPGSATLPRDPGALVAWAIDATHDPRVVVTVTGGAGGSDVDPATGSAAILAADRAGAVVAALVAGGVPAPRLAIATRITPTGPRAAIATAAFAGEPRSRP